MRPQGVDRTPALAFSARTAPQHLLLTVPVKTDVRHEAGAGSEDTGLPLVEAADAHPPRPRCCEHERGKERPRTLSNKTGRFVALSAVGVPP